jgi:hypothetical protein
MLRHVRSIYVMIAHVGHVRPGQVRLVQVRSRYALLGHVRSG